jgi:hypothetical protein
MENKKPDKTEQIEAIIQDQVYDLTMKYAGRDSTGMPQYTKVFDVTPNEILEYAKQHYDFERLPYVHTKPGLLDGFYILRIRQGYRVYYQERSTKFDDKVLEKEDDVWESYVDFILSVSSAVASRDKKPS